MFATINLKPIPFSTGPGRDVLIGDHSNILPCGTFHRKSPTKISVSLVNPNWFGCKLEEHYYKKCYVLNPLSIPNSKDSVQNLQILSFQENSLEAKDSTSTTERHTELNWKNQINIKNKLLH